MTDPTKTDLSGSTRTGTPGALEAVTGGTTPLPTPTPEPTPVPIEKMAPIFTTVLNTNYVVVLDGVIQTPSHYSAFEAAEHAGTLKLKNPDKKVVINTSGVIECALKKV